MNSIVKACLFLKISDNKSFENIVKHACVLAVCFILFHSLIPPPTHTHPHVGMAMRVWAFVYFI
jgi:hypothetical protein